MAMRVPLRYLLTLLQWPLLVKTGLRNWNKKTVPVGRSLMRLPTPVNATSLTPLFLVVFLDLEEEDEAPIGKQMMLLVNARDLRGSFEGLFDNAMLYIFWFLLQNCSEYL